MVKYLLNTFAAVIQTYLGGRVILLKIQLTELLSHFYIFCVLVKLFAETF